MREIATQMIRRLLGEAQYGELRSLARKVRSRRRGLRGGREGELIRRLELKGRFKGHVIESLGRRRTLERELAQLRYPEQYRPELGVVAEVSGQGLPASPWPRAASVIITNFNYGRYVGQAIGSVLRQTHKRVELVVVDDASSDHSPGEMARALEQVSSVPWQLIRLKHNIGLPAARNIGVKLARGEFVFILDADNHLLPGCVEDHVHAAEKSGADAAYGMVRTFGTASMLLSDADFSAQRLARGPYIDAMALFRRSALMEMGLYAMEPELYGWEDYELWVRIAALERQVAFVPSVLAHYRFHQTNMISIASLDTRGAWAYLFSTYPGIFGDMSAEKKEQEAELRALQVAESADSTFEREADVPVDCGCEDLGGSTWESASMSRSKDGTRENGF